MLEIAGAHATHPADAVAVYAWKAAAMTSEDVGVALDIATFDLKGQSLAHADCKWL